MSTRTPEAQRRAKAIWRGVIKIQQETESLGAARVKSLGKFLFTSADGAIAVEWPPSRGLRSLLKSRAKAYFAATLLSDGKIDIREEVAESRYQP